MTKCPICFKKANYTTDCHHTFCKKCLYRWKPYCPLCRRGIELKYPRTRAMSTRPSVIRTCSTLLKNIDESEESADKLKYTEKLLNHFWNNRIVIRKHYNLCKTIRNKLPLVKQECLSLGLLPPKILKKLSTI